jgi:sulfur carrier protein
VTVVVNGDDVDVAEGATVADLVTLLGLGANWVIVERNGDPVPRADFGLAALGPGDRIELVRAVAGG